MDEDYIRLQQPFTSVRPEELDCLVSVLRRTLEVSLGDVLEIGSQYGGSTIALAKQAVDYGRKVISIDHHVGDQHAGFFTTANGFVQNVHQAGMEDTIIPVVASTAAIYASRHLFAPGSCCFSFIDTEHDYRPTSQAVMVSRIFLANPSVIAFHDYDAGFPGVDQVIHELMEEHGLEVIDQAGSLVVFGWVL